MTPYAGRFTISRGPALPYAADVPSRPVGRPVAPPTAGDRDRGTQPRLSYELITPESGILLGDAEPLEVGFELLMHLEGARVLGPDVAARFGFSFPIRFDYLDTLDGGHLSLQCHPTRAYAREIFGLDYTQDETYYVMETTPGASVFLGFATTPTWRRSGRLPSAPSRASSWTRSRFSSPMPQSSIACT